MKTSKIIQDYIRNNEHYWHRRKIESLTCIDDFGFEEESEAHSDGQRTSRLIPASLSSLTVTLELNKYGFTKIRILAAYKLQIKKNINIIKKTIFYLKNKILLSLCRHHGNMNKKKRKKE